VKAESVLGEKKTGFGNVIRKSVFAGLGGYLLFLTILLFTKFISMLIQPKGTVTGIETADFILPVIGFFLLFLIKLLENFKEV
jgi:hypothetical protein